MKTKRRIFELRPAKQGGWKLVERGTRNTHFLGYEKKSSLSTARRWVRMRAPSQLLLYTLKGRIEKGRNGESSYGSDSRRRSG